LPRVAELIERRIYLIRGHKVMLDSDLAELYQVETFNLNKGVKRNLDRFPEDFMFQLTKGEAESLRSQFATSKGGGFLLDFSFKGPHQNSCYNSGKKRS
jgi:hypothetical protein